MVPRFTVIQGGLTERPTTGWASGQDPAGIAGRRLAIALAWNRDAQSGREAVRGRSPHPIWAARANPWRQAEAGALADWAAAEAVDRALRVRFGALRRPSRLAGALDLVQAPRPIRRAKVAGSAVRPRAIPIGSLIGVRPAGWEAPAPGNRAAREPEAAHDAGETLCAVDAGTAQQPIIGDPGKAQLARLVRRCFGPRGALRDAVLRRTGAIIAGPFHLGIDAASMPWRRLGA